MESLPQREGPVHPQPARRAESRALGQPLRRRASGDAALRRTTNTAAGRRWQVGENSYGLID